MKLEIKINPEQDGKLVLLSTASALGAWGAFNSSYFTVATFVDNPEKVKDYRVCMIIGLGVASLLGVGIRLVYGKKANYAMYGAIATGLGMYGLYEYRLQQTIKMNSIGQESEQEDYYNYEEL
jgi:hypothetical protein